MKFTYSMYGVHVFRKGSSYKMGFCQSLTQRHSLPWILTSATIRNGLPFDNICRLLALCSSPLHIIQCSNYQPEIQLLFCELTSLINGDSFPELDWVLDSGRSTLSSLLKPFHLALEYTVTSTIKAPPVSHRDRQYPPLQLTQLG